MKTNRVIIPAVLECELGSLYKSVKKALAVSNYIHIDYVDSAYNNSYNYNLNDIEWEKLMVFNNNISYQLHFLSDDIKHLVSYLKRTEVKPKQVFFHLDQLSKFDYSAQQEIINKISQYSEFVIAINPDECINVVLNYMHEFEEHNKALTMTVNPGRQNTPFTNNKYIDLLLENKYEILVDGGISETTINKVGQNINTFIVGSFLLNSDNIKSSYKKLF